MESKAPLGRWVVASKNGLYVRAGPSAKEKTTGVLKYKEEVIGLKRINGWLKHPSGWSLINSYGNIPFLTRLTELREVVIDKSSSGEKIQFNYPSPAARMSTRRTDNR
uniref:Uncharacterized protein n=1 Tax=Lotharella oceanica TaxID=641309 RepID=A0A7S2TKL7_9EUKA|mmetsp:Transcript_17007/g.32287  ORF Transcript_17007/g.32287 Transcript_17007/m.32287 type:complete len:108 (+) Transcript_17007:23-346(+)